MRSPLTFAETLLLGVVLLLASAALLLPGVPNPPHAHDFADQRLLLGLPCALDVLSNLAFAFGGVAGLRSLRRLPAHALPRSQLACAGLFFIGLIATALGSTWYHLAPSDSGLAIDRASMGIAFAGILGLAAAAHVSDRAGRLLARVLLVLAPASVLAWYLAGNVLPWAIVQFGGMAILVALLFVPHRPGAIAVRWGLVLLAYAFAKAFEMGDHAIYEATGQLLSGHTLKHVAAACAAWPVIRALPSPAAGQNTANLSATAAPLAGGKRGA